MVIISISVLSALAEDPYTRWSTGDARGAIPALRAQAQTSDAWNDYVDLGLAASAANDHGRAVAWLVMAHLRAPERGEPRVALHALGSAPPAGWLDALGPCAWPGLGWCGVVLSALGGLALGHGVVAGRGQRWRRWSLSLAVVCIGAAAPGLVAVHHDAARTLAATVRDSHVYDSVGNPAQAIAAGTIVLREPQTPWNHRVLVRLPDGARGFVAEADLDPDSPGQ